MTRVSLLSAVALMTFALGCASHPAAAQSPEEVTLTTSDGVQVYGDWYGEAGNSDRPVLLLFHQGGSEARGEYGPIVPRLRDAGFDILAIDQRRGGELFGGVNRTVEGTGDQEFSYCDAEPDLVAALDYVRERRPGVRPVLWGSSYSAALVLKLAAARGDEISGVLAFSPASGEPMAGCDPGDFAADVWAPVLALRPASEMENPRTAAQLEAFRELGFRTFVADPGSHGSSMLVPDRAGGDTEATWEVVLAFLDQVVSPSVP